MLSWYREMISNFGVARATLLFFRVAWRRAVVILRNRILPARLTCPCCGWQGNRFLDFIEMGYESPNAECPNCGSHSRHGALFIWLRDVYRIAEKSGTALVFSPERSTAPIWRTAPQLRLVRLDIVPSRGVDLLADLLALPLKTDVADLIWCHHVLEQVEDARVAISELRRVLSAETGDLIISVGLNEDATTREFGFADLRFSGHRRSFGNDFEEYLRNAGFAVQSLTHNLSEAERRRYGITPEKFFLLKKR